MMPRTERNLWLAIALLAWGFAAFRAARVPLIHDEAATFQTYVLTGYFLPGGAHWDAGNHLLSTAAARLSHLMLGPSPFVLRLFSVIAFGLWAWYAWRLTRSLASAQLRITASLALMLTPFLFDFFSLFRGYGPALAFLIMAVHHAIAFHRTAHRIDLLLLLLAATLAATASLTVLIITGSLLLLAALVILRERSRDALAWLMLALIGAAPFVMLSCYGMALSERGLLYYGSTEGLLRGTLASLGAWVLGIPWPLVGAALLLAPVGLAALAMRSSTHRSVLALLLLLFTAELLGRWVLGAGLGVLYPIDRTTMHVVPLAILLLAYAADRPGSAWRTWAAAGALSLLPLRMLSGMNDDRTSYWPEQAITMNLVDAAVERQHASDRPLLTGGYHQNACVWAYASMLRGGLLNPLDVNGFPQVACDLLLLDPGHFAAPGGFAMIAKASHGRAALYAREQPLRTSTDLDSTLAPWAGSTEFHDLPSPAPSELTECAWLVELDARFASDAPVLDLRLVVEVRDTAHALLHYEANDLARIKPKANGDRLRMLRRIPRLDQPPARVTVYLWNPKLQAYRADSIRIRLHRVLP